MPGLRRFLSNCIQVNIIEKVDFIFHKIGQLRVVIVCARTMLNQLFRAPESRARGGGINVVDHFDWSDVVCLAIGSGCPLLPKFDRGRLAYYLDMEELKVKISCEAGFRLHDSNRINNSLPTVVASQTSAYSITVFSLTLSCSGWKWDEAIDSLRCIGTY